MITVNFKTNIDMIARKIREEHQRQIPFAASLALNEMAFETRNYIQQQMGKHYEGGVVNFTKHSIYSSRSTKKNLEARVFVNSNGSKDQERRKKYVLSTIDGGEVVPYKEGGKPFSPNKTRIRVTSTGHNMPNKYVLRGLQKKGIFIIHRPETSNITVKSKKPAGLYQRVGKGKRTKVKLLVAFYDKQINKVSFPARTLAKDFAIRHFNKIMGKSLARAIATAN